jgi:hypothetical protein
MRQLFWMCLALAAFMLVAWATEPAYAQGKGGRRERDALPAAPVPSGQVPVEQMRAPRPNRNVMLIVAPFLSVAILWSWVAFGDWVNRDTQIFKLN